MRAPDVLKGRIARRQCVAYIGAGFSAVCGMPMWSSLLKSLLIRARNSGHLAEKHLLDACEEAFNSGNYAVCASLLRGILSDADLDEEVRNRFSVRLLYECAPESRNRMERRLDHLLKTPWAGVITTNYDQLIEHGLSSSVGNDVVSCNGSDPRLGNILATTPIGGLFFVKIHGSTSGSSLVLTTEDYDRAYLASPRISSFLNALMLRYHIVFIGCSLEDEIVRLRRKLAAEFDGLVPAAYALLPNTSENRMRRRWLGSTSKVEVILYDNDDGSHEGVDLFLEDVATAADRATGSVAGNALTLERLKQLPPSSRLESIGQINRELLDSFNNSPKKSISHINIISIDGSGPLANSTSLIELSPDERIYRVLFLVSLGFLVEEIEDGSIIYKISGN